MSRASNKDQTSYYATKKHPKGGQRHTSEESRKQSLHDVGHRRHPSPANQRRPSNRSGSQHGSVVKEMRGSSSDGRHTLDELRKVKPSGQSNRGSRTGKRETKSTPAYFGMFKAKILVIGPRECGKTVISNYLADATEISGGDYHPTQGVRILEFESSGISIGGKQVSCEVELWDCSGDQKFENCWPAIQKDVNGVLFVYNPDKINHGKELEMLYVHFVQEQGLKDSQCMLFAHHRPGANEKTRLQTPSYLSNIPCVQTNLEEDPDLVKQKFSDLLAVLLHNWTERRDEEELSIMNH